MMTTHLNNIYERIAVLGDVWKYFFEVAIKQMLPSVLFLLINCPVIMVFALSLCPVTPIVAVHCYPQNLVKNSQDNRK